MALQHSWTSLPRISSLKASGGQGLFEVLGAPASPMAPIFQPAHNSSRHLALPRTSHLVVPLRRKLKLRVPFNGASWQLSEGGHQGPWDQLPLCLSDILTDPTPARVCQPQAQELQSEEQLLTPLPSIRWLTPPSFSPTVLQGWLLSVSYFAHLPTLGLHSQCGPGPAQTERRGPRRSPGFALDMLTREIKES